MIHNFWCIDLTTNGSLVCDLFGSYGVSCSTAQIVETIAFIHVIQHSTIMGFQQVNFLNDFQSLVQNIMDEDSNISDIGHFIDLIKDLL